MGSVWLVQHRELDTERALKIIVPEIALTPEALGRFRREARVMAKLSHPHAVTVHDAQIDRDGSFIEMEYVRGRSLDALLRPGVPSHLEWVARILVQLCDVLQAAHDRQIVHRDLKPSNLMLLDGRPSEAPFLKVLDFGIAKILAPDDQCDAQTRTGAFIGCPPYTSPEQAGSGKIDGRSDLYSIGINLYEMLTGYRPFAGRIATVIHDHLYTPPPKFAEKNPDVNVPPEVEQVVLRCLAKDPDRRYQSARELAEEFLRVASLTEIALAGPGSLAPLPSELKFPPPEDAQVASRLAMASSGIEHHLQDVGATFNAVQQATRAEASGDRGRGWRAGNAGRLSPTLDRRHPSALWLLLVGFTLVGAAAWLTLHSRKSSDGRALMPLIQRPMGEARPGGAEISQGPPVRQPTSRPAGVTAAGTGPQPVSLATVGQPTSRPAGVTALARIEEGGNKTNGPHLALVIAPQEEQLMGALESLLTLPAATKVDGVTLDVRTSQPGPLRLGTRFALRVRPGASGYLVVLTVSPGGDVSFLFPNQYRLNNFIGKGQDAMIPYAQGLEIRPPVGEETYYVYLLEKNPFAGFPFGLYGEALVVGRLEDVARRLRARGTQISANELREALIRGMAIELAKPAKASETPDRCGAWVRKEVIVKSVE